MNRLPDKNAVREALREALSGALATMIDAARSSREGAIHEDSRPEGDKDMRSTEQSYVARGQAVRAEELAEDLTRFEASSPRAFGPDEPIGPGALVLVSDESGVERAFFLVPQGGGTRLDVDGVRVTVLTPASPVGEALLGCREGDDIEVWIRGSKQDWTVEAVA